MMPGGRGMMIAGRRFPGTAIKKDMLIFKRAQSAYQPRTATILSLIFSIFYDVHAIRRAGIKPRLFG